VGQSVPALAFLGRLPAPGSAAPHWPKGEPVGTCPGRNHPFAPAQDRRHYYTLVVELEFSSLQELFHCCLRRFPDGALAGADPGHHKNNGGVPGVSPDAALYVFSALGAALRGRVRL